MTPQTVSRRYAKALFDVAQRAGTLDRVERDLESFRALIASHAELGRTFENATIPLQKKRAIVDALIGASGDMSDEVKRLLTLLADRDRLPAISNVADAFQARLREVRKIVPAEIVTAVPLGDARRGALARALGKAMGGEVTLTERVDPEIIGGVVAKVGSLVFDGSVTRQIARMKQRLGEQA